MIEVLMLSSVQSSYQSRSRALLCLNIDEEETVKTKIETILIPIAGVSHALPFTTHE